MLRSVSGLDSRGGVAVVSPFDRFGGLPLVGCVGKGKGLYDRDELLIRKTTIDEAPQIFQCATLFTLVIWLSDGIIIDGSLANTQVIVLWVALVVFSLFGRHFARTIA